MEHLGPHAQLAETHVSVVVFLADRVYKLKKPVSTGFLDFSTREARQRVCHREVELNSRLSDDVYLGVADVIGPDGELCDHLVVMRRMPPHRRLSTLVRSESDVAEHLRRIARTVASFHASARTSDEIAACATQDAVRSNWEANVEQMRRFERHVLDPPETSHVADLARRYVAGRRSLFERRIADGDVRDGHGDLLADDIFCLDDGPRILDCIEFDDHLRYGDVLADVAFLAMDLERLGAPDLASLFLSWYREFSGQTYPQSLAHHYVAYRAHVRSKVACLRHEQGDQSAADEARGLLWMARRHLERAQVTLVIVGGLPGTGKTTLATGIAERRRWALLRSDEIRKELAGASGPQPAAYGEGLYTPQLTDATYTELLARARLALENGTSVVLDGSWTAERWRRAARSVAEAVAADLVELECVAGHGVASARIRGRLREQADVSDATPEIADRMRAAADPWPDAVPIDTERAPAEALSQALGVVGQQET